MTRKNINQKLVLALQFVLAIAKERLAKAKEKDNRWEISLYRKDVRIIRAQLDSELSRKK